MRAEVIASLQVLADVAARKSDSWPCATDQRYDLTLHLHTLYDDTDALPDPVEAVPAILRETEVPALKDLAEHLDAILLELGDAKDHVYFSHPGWPDVMRMAWRAWAVMETSQGVQGGRDPGGLGSQSW